MSDSTPQFSGGDYVADNQSMRSFARVFLWRCPMSNAGWQFSKNCGVLPGFIWGAGSCVVLVARPAMD